jgi:hypothetical protein
LVQRLLLVFVAFLGHRRPGTGTTTAATAAVVNETAVLQELFVATKDAQWLQASGWLEVKCQWQQQRQQ